MLAKLTIPAGRSYKFCTMMMMEACHLVGTSTAGQTTFDFSTYGKVISGAGGDLVILDNSKAGNWTPYTDWHNVDDFTTSGINYNPWFTMYTTTDKADQSIAFVQMVATASNYGISTTQTVGNYNITYQPQMVVGTAPSALGTYLNPNSSTGGYIRDTNGQATSAANANASYVHTVHNFANTFGTNNVMWNFHQMDASPTSGNSTKCVFYISINSEQFTIYQLPFDGTTDNDYEGTGNLWGGAILHYGTRTTQGWEDGYSDNPSWIMMNFFKNIYTDRGGYWTRMRQNNPWSTPSSGTVALKASLIESLGRNPISNQKYYSGSYTPSRTNYDGGGDTYADKIYPVVAYQSTDLRYMTGSGWSSATNKTTAIADSQWGASSFSSYESSLKLQMPFFRGVNESANPGSQSNNQSYAATVPVVDPNTGLTAPPAMPIMIQAANGNNAGGQLKGLMYGGHLPNASYLDSVRTKEAKYNINGNLFIPIHFNPPNWSGSTQYSTQRGVDIMWLGV